MFVWCMHVCRGQMTYVSPQNFFFETQSLIGLEFNKQAKLSGWRASPRDLSVSIARCWDYKYILQRPAFFIWVLGI